MARLPLRSAMVAVLLMAGLAPVAPAGDPSAEESARRIVERLMEANPGVMDLEDLEPENHPTRLVNDALEFAASAEGAAVLRRTLAEAIGDPGAADANGRGCPARARAADVAGFLLGREPPRWTPFTGDEFRVLHGFVAAVSRESLPDSSPGFSPDAPGPSPWAGEDVRQRLLDGKTPFRAPLRPDGPALLEAIRTRTPLVAPLLAEGEFGRPAWEGVDLSLGAPLGEAAAADPDLGRRLIEAWRGEDGRPRPQGTEERLLLLALGRWGSPEGLAVLEEETRVFLGPRALEEFSYDRMRLLGAAWRFSGRADALFRVRDEVANSLDPRVLHAVDVHIGGDFALRRLLGQARARSGTGAVGPLLDLLEGDYPWFGLGFSSGVRCEVLDFLLDRYDAAEAGEKEAARAALGRALCGQTGRAFSWKAGEGPKWMDGPGNGRAVGPLPDPVTVARVLRFVRGRDSSGGPRWRPSLLTPLLPPIEEDPGNPPATRVHAAVEKGVLRIHIVNSGKGSFTVDPTALRVASAVLYRGPGAGGRACSEFRVDFGFTVIAGETDVPAESLRIVAPGESAEFTLALPRDLPEGVVVTAFYTALRVRGGPVTAPLLERFLPVRAVTR